MTRVNAKEFTQWNKKGILAQKIILIPLLI